MYNLTSTCTRTIALPAPKLGAVILKPNESIEVSNEHFEELNKYGPSSDLFESGAVKAVIVKKKGAILSRNGKK